MTQYAATMENDGGTISVVFEADGMWRAKREVETMRHVWFDAARDDLELPEGHEPVMEEDGWSRVLGTDDGVWAIWCRS